MTFTSSGASPRQTPPLDPAIAEIIADKAKIPSDHRPSFNRMLDWLIETTCRDWARRSKEEREKVPEIYAGAVAKVFERVSSLASELAPLLDSEFGARRAPPEAQAATAILYASFRDLTQLRERIGHLSEVAAGLAQEYANAHDVAPADSRRVSFPRKGRPRGTSGAPMLDALIEKLRIIVRQHGGAELTAHGPRGKQPVGRETWGTLEPIVLALKPCLPEGFVPPVYFSKAARRRLGKK